NTPGSNVAPPAGPYTTGSHAASTRGSAAARAATSGPMPAGSPDVIAMRGFIRWRVLRAAYDRWPHVPQLPEPQPPEPQPDGLSQPPSLPQPPCATPLALGSS